MLSKYILNKRKGMLISIQKTQKGYIDISNLLIWGRISKKACIYYYYLEVVFKHLISIANILIQEKVFNKPDKNWKNSDCSPMAEVL